jgi:hypothetical protein
MTMRSSRSDMPRRGPGRLARRRGRFAALLASWVLLMVGGVTMLPADAPSPAKPAVKSSPPARSPAAVPRVSPPPVQDARAFAQQVQPFFTEHCVKCHGADKAEAKLRLDTLAADFQDRPTSDRWVEVLNRINLGEMPPEDEPKPAPQSLEQVTDWITSELNLARENSQSSGGRVVLRRLTRFEYANTVRNLLHVDFVGGDGPLEKLPPDGSIAGFDRVSRALLLDPSLMEGYLTVAQDIADRAVAFRPPLVSQRTLHYDFTAAPDTPMSYQLNGRDAEIDGRFLVIMQEGARTYSKLRHPFDQRQIPLSGKYRIRVRAAADKGTRGEPVYMDVTYGTTGRQARFRVDAVPSAPAIYEFEKTFDANDPGEFQVNIVNGTRFRGGSQEWLQRNGELTKLAEAGQSREAMREKARLRAEGGYDQSARNFYVPEVLNVETLPKLCLEWIEVIGPLQGEFPPPSLQAIFGDLDTARRFAATTSSEQILAEARTIIARLLPRAFRRPVTDAEIAGLAGVVAAELDAGADAPRALKSGLAAMLCAPDFIFLFERSAAEDTAPRRLNDYELATRLSYFLWSTLPDAQLVALAGKGKLHQPAELSREIDRMLADPLAEGFVQGFARQWLKIDEISRFVPDQQIYPDYYATDMAGIDQDVKDEPLAFFREVLRRDEPVVNFLDSDWLMLNARLAKLYGIDGVDGGELRRVGLNRSADAERHAAVDAPEQVRGGLLGMAGVHLWGADGSRTKPVERGKYILTVLFNSPPPPPPPNAGEVEPNLNGQVLTVRERLARHREQTTCNNCHRRIDPYGLAMENFNVISRWRDRQDGEKPLAHWGDNRPAIDPSGTLPSGREFTNFVEFKQAVLEQQDRFVRALAEKLLIYAVGRTLEPADRGTTDKVVARSRSSRPTLRSLIREIATSEAFLTK